MIQARKDGNTSTNEPPQAQEQTSPVQQVQRPPAVRTVQQAIDPRRTTYIAANTAVILSTEGGSIPEGGTLQYRRVSIAPQLQHVVTSVQVQATSSTSASDTPLTVSPRCTIASTQDLAQLLQAATTSNSAFQTVELQNSNVANVSASTQGQFQAATGGQRAPVAVPQRLLLNSGSDMFTLRLAPSTSGGTSQQIMVLDPSSIAPSTDVTKVHSYSLASSAMQKIAINQHKTPVAQLRTSLKRPAAAPTTPPRTFTSADVLSHLTAVNKLLFGQVASGEEGKLPAILGSPKAKRIKLEKGSPAQTAPPSREAAKRARVAVALLKKLQLLKMKYYQHQTEHFFLKGGGNLVDFVTWRKKMTPPLMDQLLKHRFEPQDDLKTIQDILSQSQVQGVRNPLVAQGSPNEGLSSSKSPSSHPQQRLVSLSPKGVRPPSYKQHSSKHNSISSVYDSQIGSQEEIVERAKQEAYVIQRIGDLRREGLWSLKRLPKVADAPRIKAHHDYLLEEMVWLATDFAQERKWKKAAAKKCARMITRYFQEKEIKAEKAEKEEQMRLRKIASIISREIKQFWNNIEKLAEYRQQTWLEEKRKKVLDTHLNFIVDQTEKYSSWLTQGMNQPAPDSPHPSEEDFSPSSSDGEGDDEATIQKEEEELDETEQSEEIKLLQQESEMPFEDFLESLPPEILNDSTYSAEQTSSKADSEKVGSEEDDEFQVSEEEEDDEQTILEQEEGEGDVNHAQEIQDLEAENEMSIEELREKYSAAFETPSDVGTPEQRSPENESRSSDEFSDEEEQNDEQEDSLLKELSSDNIDASDNPSKEISDIAATAESFQPKGNTLSTTQVCTKVPFLLKHQLREYQHIGLDWLNAMYEKKLNGILADEMGLGKTIQTISVLAHLACEKGVWGPHLIVVPTSVMLNWEMELKKWCPAFKILTYYGTPKERKQKRVGWTKPNAFHVCITSYKLVVQDHQSFRRKRWKYMILDEAQHIKNFKSQRWQMLLNFQSSHRLLLTGTPLQNNLMELWSLMHFLMPNVFQSHREFREWFVNPFTGMIEGAGDYNDSLIRRLHKVLRPFLLRRLKSEVEKQLPKKYEHIVMCRLSNRQRYLYDDFMSQTKTKETLATGNFMSVINILMQLRKVCNHPNMFEERPTVSPFMMEGIRFTTASLAYKALDYDPFKQVSLLSLNLLLADLELLLTAFAAHRVKKFQVPQKLIEEIDSQPEPPPPCPQIKMKVNFTCNSQASSGGGGSNAAPRPPSTPRPPVPPPRAPVAPQPQRFMVFPGQQMTRNSTPTAATPQAEQQYTLQLVQPGAAIGGGLTLQLQSPSSSSANRVQCIQSLIGGIGRVVQTAQGAHFVITSVANSVAETTSATTQPTTAQTSLVLGTNIATVGQRMVNPAVSPPFLSTLNRTPVPPNNRPVGRIAPFNGHPSTTPSEGTVHQNHIQTPAKNPLVHSLSKPIPKPEAPVEKKNSLFYLDSLACDREQERKNRLSTLARINAYRCSACPIYGQDLVEAVTLVHSLRHPQKGDPWSGKGHVNCLNAVACRDDPRRYWEHTAALSQIVRTPEDRVEQLYDIINRFVFGVPAVTAPAIEMHVSHPHPWRLNEERRRIEVISEHLAPSSAFLHPIVSNMNTQFPELRLIQYDCGKLQRLAHLMWELKSNQHRVLIFTQMTRMLDILEQFLNYHGHTYLRLDGNTKVEQRQALMERFNADKRIFCFILSTRSGGIGVNLTGADTVIFYDSDWNPTMDAQAQDRCHRIGQTRDVHIYRLISERTIEENILKKANQKRILGDLAIEGGNFTTAFFKKNTIHDLFGIDMQGDLKRLMAEEKRLEEEKLENEKFSEKELEQALGMAEEESDLQAAQTASAEAVAELAEFDESIPLDNDSRDNEEKSTAEEELDKLMDQLSPVERYALQFLESLQEPVSLEQLKLAEEEIEAQKKDWELGHLKALKQEEERLGDEENPLFCSREASNQIYFSVNGQEEMPMWAPPTPPTNENDIYMDCSMNFWYEPSFMHEAFLPPIFIKKEAKRQKMDPIVSAVSTARKQKVRKDDMVSIPRSLFDRPSAAILKMRREVKLQKVKGLMVSPKTPSSPQFPPSSLKQTTGSLLLGKVPSVEGSSNPHVEKEEWHVQEDWALLQVIQDLQNIPLNLTVLSPAHTPNWDLGSEAVYAVFNRYHSAKACKARYENVIVPREEGKILYDTNPKKQKKTKGIYKTKNNRPMKTSQLFLQDNNQAFMKVARENFRIIADNASKRRAQERTPFLSTSLKTSTKVPSILAENGINFDQPLTPMQIAQLRSERIAREKQKNTPIVPLAMAPVLQTVASPQVAAATVVSQVPEQQQTTVTVATGSMHPHQAQAVLASLQAQQQLQLKGQASMSLSKSLTSGIMVSSSTASTLASLTKALGQNPQATNTQNAAIAAALSNAAIRNQRATTTMSVQEIVAAGGQVRTASTAAPVVGGISTASAVVSVSNLAAVQLATSQRLAGATLSPVTTVASASGTVTQLNPQAAATQRSIAQMTQMQQMRQNVIRRETALKQQLKRIQQQQQGATQGAAAAAKSGQPRVAQQVTMKQAAVGRPMTEAEVTQLMKRQQQKHAVNVNLTASQILAQVQPQQVAISSGATLVKTVSSPLAIPVSAVTMGGVNINVSVPQGKAGVVQAKGATTITNQQLRQFQLQQQLLQARKGSKMTTANLTQIAKVPGKAGVSAGTSVQIVPQGVKNLQTAMTVAQIQQAMKQLPQNMPVVVTATPSLSGVQQQPVGSVKATTLPSTTLTTSGVLKGSTALTPQAVTLAVRAAQGQQQLQIQVQQSPHPTLVTPQTQVVSTAALTQARMQLQPLQTVTVQQQQPIIQQQADHQTTVTATPPTPAQLVQQTNTQMVQQAIQLAKQQQAQAAAAAAAAQQNKASPYTMRLRNPPK